MPRKNHPRRTLPELFSLSREIGQENVLLTDHEFGAVIAGDDGRPIAAGTIYNMRYTGRLNTPIVRTGHTPRTRLSDALAFVAKKTRSAA